MNRLLYTTLIATVSLTALAQSAQADFFEKVTGIEMPLSTQKIDPDDGRLIMAKPEEEDLWSFTKAHITRDGRAFGDRVRLGQSSYLGKARKVQRGNMIYWQYWGKGYSLSRFYGLARHSRPGTYNWGSPGAKSKQIDFQQYRKGLRSSNTELQRIQQSVYDSKEPTNDEKVSETETLPTQKEE